MATQDPKIAMRALIQEHSQFQRHTQCSKPVPDAQVVLLTGATGGLGSHLVSQLSTNPSITRIYCLLRGLEPLKRLQSSLQDRKLDMQGSKVTAVTSDLAHPTLGLDESTFFEMQSSITHIIHAAWPVNFQLPLSSFEPHIQGLHNLLRLSLSSPFTSPAKFLFCSSVSTALGSPSPTVIPENIIEDLDHALDMGYGQSKLVGEHIVAAAVKNAGAQASILRIGQVVGDSKFGMWNEREAFPSIVRSALTMGILPELQIKCEWLPVDTLAECVIELAGLAVASGNGKVEETREKDEAAEIEMKTQVVTSESKSNTFEDSTDLSRKRRDCDHDTSTTAIEKPKPQQQQQEHTMNIVYNILSPQTISWTHSILPALHHAGLSFTAVPTDTWLQTLRALSHAEQSPPSSSSSPLSQNTNNNSNTQITLKAASDPDQNPALKLLQYYEDNFKGKDEQRDGMVEFEIEMAKRDS
ncbi:MAG: hypothetical protein Q9168_008121, partial [Polycauliona sp. 1 TL-2023]